MRAWPMITAVFLMAGPALAAPALKPALAGLDFLVGDWGQGAGRVADTGGTSSGQSRFTIEAGGGVLLRRDHTDLRDAAGKPSGSFEQIMMIYPEGGTLHADYADGTHVIHYVSAAVVPGQSVVFTSAAPAFRLAYTLGAAGALNVEFGVVPPGGAGFHAIAVGALKREK